MNMKKIGVILLIICCFLQPVDATTKRAPAVAGTFYPADSAELMSMVNQHLKSVGDLPKIDGQILALIVPHAGLIYSGEVAAYAYKMLEGTSVDKVILCGPSHRYRFSGISVYGPYIAWTMPFGTIQCDGQISSAILNYNENIQWLAEPHLQEHSLEVQLPYLKAVLDDFRIVPMVMGSQDSRTIELLSGALESLDLDQSTIMVASSDWQHYRSAAEGWKYDSLGLDCIENMDPGRLEAALNRGNVEMCGGGPAVAIMKAAIAKGADKAKILKYGDSGDKSGDKGSVVGYAAVVIYKSNANTGESQKSNEGEGRMNEILPEKFELSKNDKNLLLDIARKTLKAYLANEEIPEFEVPDNLKQPGAGFVTLEKSGLLRGCIGHTQAIEPLYQTISSCAIKAAVADPRFQPVTGEELNQLHIEISVLTPMQKVSKLDEIQVGRDGLMIIKGPYRGLLLPQVATDYNWDKKTFLEHTCQKAGLHANAYLEKDTELYKFQAVIFSEEE